MGHAIYVSALGGHAPDYLRAELDAFIETGEVQLPSEPSYFSYSEAVGARLQWLIWELWHCSDSLPARYCVGLGLGQSATYADAARLVGKQEEARQL